MTDNVESDIKHEQTNKQTYSLFNTSLIHDVTLYILREGNIETSLRTLINVKHSRSIESISTQLKNGRLGSRTINNFIKQT